MNQSRHEAEAGWPSSHNFLGGFAFAAMSRCADPNSFIDALEAEGAFAADATVSAAVDELSAFVARWSDLQSAVEEGLSQRTALRHLLAHDAGELLQLLKATDPQWLDPQSVEETIPKLLDVAQSLQLDVSSARMRVVDRFPEPYADATFAAMTYDRGDQRLHGIEPGVVLLREQLRPVYSVCLLAHEFIHLVIGRVDTDILARGLEEGLSDLAGQLMFASKFLPKGYCERVLMNSRSRYGRPQLGRLYRDSLLSALTAYLLVGDTGILALLQQANRDGRQVVKDFERRLSRGELRQEEPETPREFAGFAQRFLAMTPDLVVSPLALILAERCILHETAKATLRRLRVEEAEGRKALDELQERVFLVIQSEGQIASCEGTFYTEIAHLRYEAPGDGG
jgi:hypothetical protein